MTLAVERSERDIEEKASRPRKLRLIWVMLLRVGLISVLLGATVIFNYRSVESFSQASPRFLLALIAVTYLGTIIYAIWYRSGRAITLLTRVQLAFDLAFWGCLTYVTGGIISGFTFLFDLWIIVSAVVLGGRASFVMAGASSLVLFGLGITMFTGVLAPLSDQAVSQISTREFIYFLSINVIALFVVAALVNSLVARLEITGLGLEAERVRRADLAQLHADMIRSLTVGIATTGKSGEILMMNPAGLHILNTESEQVEGQPLSQWLPDVAKLPIPEKRTLSRGNGIGITSDKTRVPVESIVAPLVDADGSRRGSIVVFSDLTEVRRLEAQLEQSRRLAALGELAASLAHEIRNPLGAISGSFQMLAGNSDLKEGDLTLVGIISRELYRMERLVGDMLDYARPREKRVDWADIGKLIEETVQVFLKGKDCIGRIVNVDIEAGANLSAEVDHSQIRQVMWNLLRNAAQATEMDGHIEAAASEDGNRILITVSDTGLGISDRDQSKIFNPFFSTRERGLGLGLALCKRIIEDHGGEITAKSRPEGGSIFKITLPREDGENRDIYTI
ncbi:MAG: PAS domain-containing protein [Proteobacteria bacterium]|nr:PAS domain-containing protein [Pseudomonadota bacterium]